MSNGFPEGSLTDKNEAGVIELFDDEDDDEDEAAAAAANGLLLLAGFEGGADCVISGKELWKRVELVVLCMGCFGGTC